MRFTIECEDRSELMLAIGAEDMARVLDQIFQTARQQIKHGDESRDRVALEAIRQMAAEFVGE